jgi:ribosomal-protein-alanine N-acetyltransferase
VENECDLLNIAVAEEHRREGLGKVMLSRLMSGAKRRGAGKMFLEVRTSNVAAKGLYLQAGFEEISVRKKYYPDGEDAVVMVKKL